MCKVLYNGGTAILFRKRLNHGRIYTMGQMVQVQLPRASINSTKLGAHHKDNEIDLFRIVDFFECDNYVQATKGLGASTHEGWKQLLPS